MDPSKDKELDVLYDHYKESCSTLSSNLRVRIRLVLAILIVLTLMVFQGTDPDNANTLASEWLGSQATGNTSLKVHLDPRFISFLLWFALSSLLVQAYQKSLLIEKQANYVRDVEASVDQLLGSWKIGGMRLKRPDYFRYSNYLYFWGFLLISTVISFGKLWLEVGSLKFGRSLFGASSVFVLLDIVMAGVIGFYSYRFCVDYRKLASQSQAGMIWKRPEMQGNSSSKEDVRPAYNPGASPDANRAARGRHR